MAEKIVVTYEDDLTGKPYEEGETIQFAVDGKQYEVDLAAANARKFRTVLAKYAAAGRKVNSRERVSSAAPKGHTNEVRQWARAVGFTVGAKGRIPGEIQRAYDKAHSG